MNAVLKLCPLARAQERIERSWLRYQLATTDAWKDRWQFGYLAALSAERAIKAVALVRHPGSTRDVQPGLRQVGQRPVAATSDTESTTVFVDRSNRGFR